MKCWTIGGVLVLVWPMVIGLTLPSYSYQHHHHLLFYLIFNSIKLLFRRRNAYLKGPAQYLVQFRYFELALTWCVSVIKTIKTITTITPMTMCSGAKTWDHFYISRLNAALHLISMFLVLTFKCEQWTYGNRKLCYCNDNACHNYAY